MADTIKTVTDKSQFEMIFRNFFMGHEVFLKTKSGNLSIHYHAYGEDKVSFKIPYVKYLPEVVVIFTRHNTNTIYSSLKFIENTQDIFVFMPIKFQIISEARREDRKLAAVDGTGKNIVYLNSIMSDFSIKNEMTMYQKKVDNIRETIIFELSKQFDRIRLYFIGDGKIDFRLKYLQENETPIYITDINSKPDQKRESQYSFYINEIYNKDYRLSAGREYISEATVPITYRNMIPYGYLQVNSKTPLTDGLYSVIKKMGIVAGELFRKSKMFMVEDDKFLISDLSKGGMSVVFKERRQIRFFRQDSFVCFDVLLPSNKKASVAAKVKNITFLDGGTIKAGMQIVKIDALSEVNYDEYLESVGLL